jgi:hypothetical protein
VSNHIFRHTFDFTLVSNAVFDHIMPALSSDGWKVLCVAIRQTWGWPGDKTLARRGESARLGVDQFVDGTGIKDRAAVERALAECLAVGCLVSFPAEQDAQTGAAGHIYALNTAFELSDLAGLPADEAPETEPEREALVLSPEQESARQALTAFGREMGVDPDPAQVQEAVLQSDAGAVLNWIEIGRAMTNLAESLRFETVVQRLLDRVPALPLSMLGPEPPEPEPGEKVGAQEPGPETLDAQELWQATLEALKSQMRRSKFKWLEPTQALELAGGVLTVQVPNKRTKEWLEEGQPAADVEQALNAVAGGPIEVTFVVGK